MVAQNIKRKSDNKLYHSIKASQRVLLLVAWHRDLYGTMRITKNVLFATCTFVARHRLYANAYTQLLPRILLFLNILTTQSTLLLWPKYSASQSLRPTLHTAPQRRLPMSQDAHSHFLSCFHWRPFQGHIPYPPDTFDGPATSLARQRAAYCQLTGRQDAIKIYLT